MVNGARRQLQQFGSANGRVFCAPDGTAYFGVGFSLISQGAELGVLFWFPQIHTITTAPPLRGSPLR